MATLASHIRTFGSDAATTFSPHPWLAIQAHTLHFDRRSSLERQPLTFAKESVLTWDGRLDNRDDLLLRLHHDVGHDQSDASLVATAYHRWALDSLPELIGDWSLAIWDAAERRVVLARDYAGNRPLYYLERPHLLAWSTSLDALIHGFELAVPDEEYIAGVFMGVHRPDITPFAGVRMLRAGHVLVGTPDGRVDVKRHWALTPRAITYRHPHDYSDHLRHLLTEAVRVRLRSSRTVWPHLSGGFDSSSIVCLAHRLVVGGSVEAPRIQPLTWVVPNAPEYDDSEFVDAVERWCNLTTVRSLFSRYQSCASVFAGGRRPVTWLRTHHEDDILEAGDHIVLSGYVGDVVMLNTTSASLGLLDHLYQQRPLQFLKECGRISRTTRRPIWSVIGRLISQLRPRYEQERTIGYRIRQGRITPYLRARVPASLSYDSLAVDFPRTKRLLVLNVYRHLDGPSVSPDTMPRLWKTYPFTHRPLVEFVLAAPPLALWNPLTARAGMKAALADVLPQALLRRTEKMHADIPSDRFARARAEDFDRSKNTLGPSENWELVRRGYADRQSLEAALAVPDVTRPPTSSYLMVCVELEAWLRAGRATRTVSSHDVFTAGTPGPLPATALNAM
jgi:asparagine synthase (glutamine-hydrolysing)